MASTRVNPPAIGHAQRLWGAKLWILQFIIAAYSAVVAGALFGIPLTSVVDVVFPLQLLIPIFPTVVFILCCAVIDGFAESRSVSSTLLGYALTPFAASAVYILYAYFDRDELIAQSQFFGAFQHVIGHYLESGMRISSDFFFPQNTFVVPKGLSNYVQFALAGAGLLFSVTSLIRTTRAQSARYRAVPSVEML